MQVRAMSWHIIETSVFAWSIWIKIKYARNSASQGLMNPWPYLKGDLKGSVRSQCEESMSCLKSVNMNRYTECRCVK